MTHAPRIAALLIGSFVAAFALPSWAQREYQSGRVWPEPKTIAPGAEPGAPPSDAIILFDGKDMSKWDGGERWLVADGVVTARGGDITTKQPFGDAQIHVEWAAPVQVRGSGQQRGNSGVYIMGRYEVQILDSYNNTTYFDGQAGSLYKQHPPLVNASRKPGEWQIYDIVFTAPRFEKDGKLKSPTYVTVLHNGVLVQNHFEMEGTSSYNMKPAYTAHAEKEPLRLQFHDSPVRFRSIWIRELSTLTTISDPQAARQP